MSSNAPISNAKAIGCGVLLLFFFGAGMLNLSRVLWNEFMPSGCRSHAPKPPAASEPVSAPTNYESTSEFSAGYARGNTAGLDFAESADREPDFAALSRMNGIMQLSTPSNREAWRRGWVKGAQDGYRGIKPSTRDESAYVSLSVSVARPGVKRT